MVSPLTFSKIEKEKTDKKMGDIIKKWRDKTGLSQKEAAEILTDEEKTVSERTVTRWENEGVPLKRVFSIKEKIAAHLINKGLTLDDEIHVDELLTFDEKPPQYQTKVLTFSDMDTNLPVGDPLILYDIQVSATNVNMYDDLLNETPVAKILLPGQERAKFAIQVFGDCMYPSYCNGDWITARFIERMDDLEYGRAYLIITHETRVVKRVYQSKDDDRLTLRCDNTSRTQEGERKYPDYDVRKENIRKMAIVVGKIARDTI